jgi:hypothetical protein
MLCPNCKTDGAYVGFTSIECINNKCKYYCKALKEFSLRNTGNSNIKPKIQGCSSDTAVLFTDDEDNTDYSDPEGN